MVEYLQNISVSEQAPIKEVMTAAGVLSFLGELPADTVLFFDIDDTLITPVSKTFRCPPSNQLIDEIKAHRELYEDYSTIISSWRLQRRVMLLDSSWPSMLRELKKKFTVYGLTKIDTGPCGPIASSEAWRSEELKGLGLEFSKAPLLIASPFAAKEENGPAFHEGIIFTGKGSKKEALERFFPEPRFSTLVMVDDRLEHLNAVKLFCEEHEICFVGMLFKGLTLLTERPDPLVAAFQKEHLLHSFEWLEDEEALKRMEAQFTLDPRLKEETVEVVDLALSKVLLMNNALFPWAVLVPKRWGAKEIIDLSPEDQGRLMQEISALSHAMVRCFHPYKINVAALGNVVSQLHIHIIARDPTDLAWPNPVFGGSKQPYSSEALEKTRGGLRKAIESA
ncbi:MAG: DUF2608 domain-containing protein [Verrucomicrobia bacterium]|nr:DUF2608 domain-containing protein [Verrucomicrobiota bacterium]